MEASKGYIPTTACWIIFVHLLMCDKRDKLTNRKDVLEYTIHVYNWWSVYMDCSHVTAHPHEPLESVSGALYVRFLHALGKEKH